MTDSEDRETRQQDQPAESEHRCPETTFSAAGTRITAQDDMLPWAQPGFRWPRVDDGK